MLVKYGVFTNLDSSKDVKRLFDNLLDEDEKSLALNALPEQNSSHKINYYLHPRIFKLILIRSRNVKPK